MTLRGRGAAKPLRRKVAVREPKKTVMIWCEGSKTEPQYLEALRDEPNVKVVADVDIRLEDRNKGAVPLTLVQQAVARRQRNQSERGEIDEFWCVFDVEAPQPHPHLDRALDLARRHSIRTAISNPCFEIWLMLHFQPQGAGLTNDEARRLSRTCDPRRDKNIDGAKYMPRRAQAKARAKALENTHESNETPFPHNNPSSGMHALLESVGG